MSSILLPILIASFVAYQVDDLKMKKYDMVDEKGEVLKVQFSKNGQYSCPLSCSLNHYHYAALNNSSQDDNNDIWSVDLNMDKNGVNYYKVNGYHMDSYTALEASKKMPKQSVPIAFNGKQND